MSYFGTQLDALLQRNKMKAAELARLSGVAEPTISKYRSGDQVWVSAEDLERLAQAISQDPQDRAELIRAHLLDECNGPGKELIDITLNTRSGGTVREIESPYGTIKLPADMERHLTLIREWVIKDQNVREIIEGLGELLAKCDPRKPGPRPKSSSPTLSAVEAAAIEDLNAAFPPKRRRGGPPGAKQ